MKKIVHEAYWFSLQDEQGTFPLPPGYHVYGYEGSPLQLTVRLRSTRGGSAASWMAGSEARKALNSAPYQPVLRALVSEFEWWPPNTVRHRPPSWFTSYSLLNNDQLPPDVICQFGSGVLNFYARVLAPQPDPLRELIAEIVTSPRGELRARQGALEIYRMVVPEEQLQLLRRDTCHWLYNHSVLGPSLFAYRVLEGRAYGILVPLYEQHEVAVVSPDHLDSPVRLSGACWREGDELKYRAFLLIHHIPRPERGID